MIVISRSALKDKITVTMIEKDKVADSLIRWGTFERVAEYIIGKELEVVANILAKRYVPLEDDPAATLELYILCIIWGSQQEEKSSNKLLMRQVIEIVNELTPKDDLGFEVEVPLPAPLPQPGRISGILRRLFLGLGVVSAVGFSAVSAVVGPGHVVEYGGALYNQDRSRLKSLAKEDLFSTLEIMFPDDPLAVGFGAQLARRIEDGMYVETSDFLILLNPMSSEAERHEQIRAALQKYREHDLEEARWQRFLSIVELQHSELQSTDVQLSLEQQNQELLTQFEAATHPLPEQVTKVLDVMNNRFSTLLIDQSRMFSQVVYPAAFYQAREAIQESDGESPTDLIELVAWKVWLQLFLDQETTNQFNIQLRRSQNENQSLNIDWLYQSVTNLVVKELEQHSPSGNETKESQELSFASMEWFIDLYQELRGGTRMEALSALQHVQLTDEQIRMSKTTDWETPDALVNGAQAVPDEWIVLSDKEFFRYLDYLLSLESRQLPAVSDTVYWLCSINNPDHPLTLLTELLALQDFNVLVKTEFKNQVLVEYLNGHHGLAAADIALLVYLDDFEDLVNQDIDQVLKVARNLNAYPMSALWVLSRFLGYGMSLEEMLTILEIGDVASAFSFSEQERLFSLYLRVKNSFAANPEQLSSMLARVVSIQPNAAVLDLLSLATFTQGINFKDWEDRWLDLISDPRFSGLFSRSAYDQNQTGFSIIQQLATDMSITGADVDLPSLFELVLRFNDRPPLVEPRDTNNSFSFTGLVENIDLAHQVLDTGDFDHISAAEISFLLSISSNYQEALDLSYYFFPKDATEQFPQQAWDAFDAYQMLANSLEPPIDGLSLIRSILPQGFTDPVSDEYLLRSLLKSHQNPFSTHLLEQHISNSSLSQASVIQKYCISELVYYAESEEEVDQIVQKVLAITELGADDNQGLALQLLDLWTRQKHGSATPEDRIDEYLADSTLIVESINDRVQLSNTLDHFRVWSSLVIGQISSSLTLKQQLDRQLSMLETSIEYQAKLRELGYDLPLVGVLYILANYSILANQLTTSFSELDGRFVILEENSIQLGYTEVDLAQAEYLQGDASLFENVYLEGFKAPMVFFGPDDGGFLKVGDTRSEILEDLSEEQLLAMFAYGERLIWYRAPGEEISSLKKLKDAVSELNQASILEFIEAMPFFATPNPVMYQGRSILENMSAAQRKRSSQSLAYVASHEVLYFVQSTQGREYIVVVPAGVEYSQVQRLLEQEIDIEFMLVQDPTMQSALTYQQQNFLANAGLSMTWAYVTLPLKNDTPIFDR